MKRAWWAKGNDPRGILISDFEEDDYQGIKDQMEAWADDLVDENDSL